MITPGNQHLTQGKPQQNACNPMNESATHHLFIYKGTKEKLNAVYTPCTSIRTAVGRLLEQI